MIIVIIVCLIKIFNNICLKLTQVCDMIFLSCCVPIANTKIQLKSHEQSMDAGTLDNLSQEVMDAEYRSHCIISTIW